MIPPGIPLLEKSGMERWGNDADYAEYVHNTGQDPY